ncbi:MAG TPA: asparagine synthase (glutamine-hydrolyzing) [Candidatus Didemnitutus sp.]|nr:asparagine synthase (glutamine-hydrolyzing) [Candidatus Didemnitutus sp.]
MCGIVAVVSPFLPADARNDAVAHMIAAEKHRGPDDQGIVSSGPATLGMCRLAIIDPEKARQPMSSIDGRFHLVFNGAIYNFRELRRELAGGWNFVTNGDTEVLLAGLSRHGEKFLPRLRGMFAFAFWDAHERMLLAARDPFGIKPLYFARLEDGLVLASELRALAASRLHAMEIDPASVAEYLAWFSVPAPRTLYRGVTNLAPGHRMRLSDDGRLDVRRWWQLPAPRSSERAASQAEFERQLRLELADTIRAHQVADVPVGAFLSGGLDSTAVVALMRAAGADRLKTFTVTFDDPTTSEAEPARNSARALGTEHHEERVTGERVASEIGNILRAFDAPTGDGINTYFAAAAARNGGVKVALSGLGGDELFGGYPSFRDLPRLHRALGPWRQVPRSLRGAIVRRLQRASSARSRKLADFLAYARDWHELAALQRRVLPEANRLALLSPDARRQAERLGPMHPSLDEFVAELLDADPDQIISAWELRTYMTDVLLRDSDVFSMAHSLELRVPFIDPKFISWLWPQPAAWRIGRPGTKSALADATADVVPAEIRRRRKQGFTLPFARWMRRELRPFLVETFSSASLARCPWLEAPAVSQLWRDFERTADNRNWSRVWAVAVLVAFCQEARAA